MRAAKLSPKKLATNRAKKKDASRFAAKIKPMNRLLTLSLLLCSSFSYGQEVLDTVVISAARFEQSLMNSSRNVQIISGEEIEKAPVNTVAELLDFMVGIDARQRGMYGTQTDLSIRGGNFEQVLVLVNGVRLSDPQTGHHLMNLPVAKEDIERIEVLLGGGSYIFGANAFSGALNIITKKSKNNSTSASLSYGSYNTLQARISQNIKGKHHQTKLSAGHNRSDGFIRNTDFTQHNASLQSNIELGDDKLLIQAGYTDQAFGAQNFYSSNFPEQFEQTKTLFGSLNWQSERKWKIDQQIYWRRNWDEFQLYREGEDYYRFENGQFTSDYNQAPSWYTRHNYHRSDVAGAKVDGKLESKLGTTALGLDYRYEQVRSNNLGDSLEQSIDIPSKRDAYYLGAQRHNISMALQHQFSWRSLQWSAALQSNYNSDFGFGLYPALNAGYRISPKQQIYTSFNRSFRFPSYTDLYYRLGGAIGSQDLKQEESYNYEIGYRFLNKGWYFNLSLFRRQGENIIDWTQACDSCDLIAGNTSSVNFNGMELSLRKNLDANLLALRYVELGYSYLQNEDQQSDEIFRSLYVFDYLQHKASLRIGQRLGEHWSLNYFLSYQKRKGEFLDAKSGSLEEYPPVFLVNASINYDWKSANFFVSAQNLLDQRYFDRANVELPGLWITLGLKYQLNY